MWLVFFMYFLIISRSREDTTLLVTIITPSCSEQIKSTLMSNLMLCNDLLMLVTWSLLSSMNLVLLLLLIGTITYFLDRFFMVILSFGLGLPLLLIIFSIFSILLALWFRKASLILRTSLVVIVVGLDV